MRSRSYSSLISWAVRSAITAGITTAVTTSQVLAQASAQTPSAQSSESASVQTTDSEQTTEEVVVTGYRESLNQALDKKRAEVAAVDAILAEDIADFPDLNLAEAIQRIPGVTINREGGQGRTITVRGLGGNFTRTNINGMETVAGTTGNRDRGFDFNVFASELFQSIVVRKTQTADLDEGSLGATVDLQTARPFDFDGFRTALSGQASYNDVTENTNPRAAGLVSWANDDRTFGALFSAAYSERNPFDEGFGTTRWGDNGQAMIDRTPRAPGVPAPRITGNFGSCLPCANPQEVQAVNEAFHPRIPRYAESLLDQKRYGLTAALQWQPAESTLINFDALYAYYRSQTENANAGSISFSRMNATGINETIVRDYALAGNNLVYGVFDNVDVRSENSFERHITKYHQFTLSGTHKFTDTFRLTALLGTSENDLQTPYNFSFAYDAVNVDGYTYDFRGNDRLPYLVHGIDMTNPALWTLTEARRRESSVVNSYDTGKFALEYDLTDNITVKGGVLVKSFEIDLKDFSAGGALAAGRQLVGVGDIARLLAVGRDLNIPTGSDRTYLVPDVWKSAGFVGLFSDPAYALTVSTGDTRNVKEDDASAFLSADFNYDVFNMPLRGSAGIRYAETEVTSTGLLTRSGNNQLVRVDNDYTDTLPSLNLVLEPTSDLLVRAAVAKVMARPALGDLTPGGTLSLTANPPTLTFGNPLLNPFRATNYDMGVEWYFKDEALVGLGLFYKDIKSFSVRDTRSIAFSDTGLPLDLIGGIDPATPFDITRNINGEGGWIRGLEFQYQQPFTFLPGIWSNFGFIGNYTYIESSVNYADRDQPALRNDLLNLSRNTYNLTLYYETQKFSARISSAFRGKYLTTFPGGNGNSEEGVNDAINIDASVSYNITEKFSVSLEGINLTDEYTDAYVGDDNLVSRYRHTGRELLLGVRWTY